LRVTHLPEETERALVEGRCRAPFDALGLHPAPGGGWLVRAFIPWARSVTLTRRGPRAPLERVGEGGLFERTFPRAKEPFRYKLLVEDPEGVEWQIDDPYRFGPTLDEGRLHAYLDGTDRRIHETLGAVPVRHEGVEGTRFAVWAPHAEAVSLTGVDMKMDAARVRPSLGALNP
jgi:1,4-alpha-glucan branching enzyme